MPDPGACSLPGLCCAYRYTQATFTDQDTLSLSHPPGSAVSSSSASHTARRRRTLREVVAEFFGDVATVCRQRVWVSVCAAYTAYVAVLGVYAYWGPQVGGGSPARRSSGVPGTDGVQRAVGVHAHWGPQAGTQCSTLD